MTTRRQPTQPADLPASRRGALLVVEGLDGAGTTTQAALLAAELRGRGRSVVETREPSDGPVGRVCRAHILGDIDLDPVAAALAFIADRADHLHRIIRPALDDGAWVVCDRYLLSTLAYQGADGADRAWILECSQDVDVPELTIVIELDAGQRARRMSARAVVERYEHPDLQDRLERAYIESASLLRERGHRVEAVAGDGGPEQVKERVLDLVDALGIG